MVILDSGVLAFVKDMAIAGSVNLVTGVAILVFVFVEPESESALGIIRLHPFGHKENAEKSSEEATDTVGGNLAADTAHNGC